MSDLSPGDTIAPAPNTLPPALEKPAAKPKPPRPWHLLGFAIFPILSLFATNTAEVAPSATVRPLVLTLVVALVLVSLASVALRGVLRGAALVSGWLLLWYSYGQGLILAPNIIRFISVFWPVSVDGGNLNRVLLPIWGALALLLIVLVARCRRNFTPLTQVMNVIALALVVVPLLSSASALLHQRSSGVAPPASDVPEQAGLTPSLPRRVSARDALPTPDAPDIYYIILDTYGRQDRLREFFGLNNEPFLRELEKRGFFVARQGRPNYIQTTMSLASSLNMTYMDEVGRRNGIEGGLAPASAMVNDNAVAAFLKTKGYKWVAVTNEFPPTHITHADVVMNPDMTLSASATTASSRKPPALSNLTAFEGLLLAQTPLEALPHAEASLYDEHRAIITNAFQCMEDAPKLPYRKFVFVHILAPHPPFVFGPQGEPIDPPRPFTLGDGTDFTRRSPRSEYRQGYRDAVQYVNTRTLTALDKVFARSKVRPIVIVQGDHGSRMELDWQDIQKTTLREVFGNLNAFSLPDGKAADVFYSDITPVNSFRLLFNHQFGAKFTKLPDRCYYSMLRTPFHTTDVTDATAK